MKVIFDLSWVHCVWWRSVLESQQWGYFAVVIIFSCPIKWLMSEKNHRQIIWHHELSWTGITKKTIHIRFLFENQTLNDLVLVIKNGTHVVWKDSWKNEKMESFKLDNLKLENFHLSWRVFNAVSRNQKLSNFGSNFPTSFFFSISFKTFQLKCFQFLGLPTICITKNTFLQHQMIDRRAYWNSHRYEQRNAYNEFRLILAPSE